MTAVTIHGGRLIFPSTATLPAPEVIEAFEAVIPAEWGPRITPETWVSGPATWQVGADHPSAYVAEQAPNMVATIRRLLGDRKPGCHRLLETYSIGLDTLIVRLDVFGR